jgi:hypothetical protein
MSRFLLKIKAENSTKANEAVEELHRDKELTEGQINRRDSFVEFNLVSTRGDGSFEYSEYDDQSYSKSQSFVDETNGPLLLAFVEDYILGQRLEILDTCETDEEAASVSSSSSGSETCFSHDESGIIKCNKTENKCKLENPESERLSETNDARLRCAKTAKQSRWDILLQSLSVSKRVAMLNKQTDSLLSLQKRNISQQPRLKNLGTSKAPGKSEETEELSADHSDKQFDAHVRSLPATKRLVKSEAKENHGDQSMEESAPVVEEFKNQRGNRGSDQRMSNITTTLCSEISKPKHIDKVSSAMKITLPANTPIQSKLDEKPESELSVHTEGVEIPVGRKFSRHSDDTDNAGPQQRISTGKGRLTLLPRFETTCDGECYENQPAERFQSYADARNKAKSIRKPILCSNCRCRLTEKSICALLSDESMIKDTWTVADSEAKNDQTVFSFHSSVPENGGTLIMCPTQNLEQLLDATSEYHGDTKEDHFDAKINISDHGSVIDVLEKQLDPIKDTADFDSKQRGHIIKSVNSSSLNIETRITTPQQKVDTSFVQIAFKDWAGNDVEIIQESPRKFRSLWMQSIISKTRTQHPSDKSPHANSKKPIKPHDHDQIIKIEDIVASSASVCNYEMTSFEIAKKCTKSKHFGRDDTKPGADSRGVLISPVNMASSLLDRRIDGASQKNTECCLEPSAVSIVSRVVDAENEMNKECSSEKNVEVKAETCVAPIAYYAKEKESDCVHDVAYHGNTECCLESTEVAQTNQAVNDPNDDVKELPQIDYTKTGMLKDSKQSSLAEHSTEEAFLLERAMQQVNAEGRFDMDHFKSRRSVTSPVTLYRFLDYNPCRNELVQENSYDFMYNPIGLSVCQLPEAAQLPVIVAQDDKVEHTKSIKNQPLTVPEISKPTRLKQGSSFQKVLRRLSKPNRVAFRENLVEIYSKESEPNQSFLIAESIAAADTGAPIFVDSNNARDSVLAAGQNGAFVIEEEKASCEAKIELKEKLNSLLLTKNLTKNAAKEKLRALLSERSSRKNTSIGIKTKKLREGSGSHTSLGSPIKTLGAINAEFRARRKNKFKSHRHVSEAITPHLVDQVDSKSHAAKILEEFRKVQAEAQMCQRTTNGGDNENASAAEECDATFVTYGTKQSQISSVSRLTIEEKKLALRLLNDIKLLTMIERKRQAMGQVQSSLKTADITKSVQMLKSIEASRKNRKVEENATAMSKEKLTISVVNSDDSSVKNASMHGGKSTLSEITSSKKVNQ